MSWRSAPGMKTNNGPQGIGISELNRWSHQITEAEREESFLHKLAKDAKKGRGRRGMTVFSIFAGAGGRGLWFWLVLLGCSSRSVGTCFHLNTEAENAKLRNCDGVEILLKNDHRFDIAMPRTEFGGERLGQASLDGCLGGEAGLAGKFLRKEISDRDIGSQKN
jgi:hypothetical protein